MKQQFQIAANKGFNVCRKISSVAMLNPLTSLQTKNDLVDISHIGWAGVENETVSLSSRMWKTLNNNPLTHPEEEVQALQRQQQHWSSTQSGQGQTETRGLERKNSIRNEGIPSTQVEPQQTSYNSNSNVEVQERKTNSTRHPISAHTSSVSPPITQSSMGESPVELAIRLAWDICEAKSIQAAATLAIIARDDQNVNSFLTELRRLSKQSIKNAIQQIRNPQEETEEGRCSRVTLRYLINLRPKVEGHLVAASTTSSVPAPTLRRSLSLNKSHKFRPSLQREAKGLLRMNNGGRCSLPSPLGENPYQCMSCGEAFSNLVALRGHVNRHEIRKPSECEVCCQTVNQYCGVEPHKESHRVGQHACTSCGEAFSNLVDLRGHVNRHAVLKKYQCELCHLVINESCGIKPHKKAHHRATLFECKSCRETFSKPVGLRAHVKTHTMGNKSECGECKQVINQSCGVEPHKRSHRIGDHECMSCGENFGKVDQLKAHLKAHTMMKPYECQWCKQVFNESCGVEPHKESHRMEKPYGSRRTKNMAKSNPQPTQCHVQVAKVSRRSSF